MGDTLNDIINDLVRECVRPLSRPPVPRVVQLYPQVKHSEIQGYDASKTTYSEINAAKPFKDFHSLILVFYTLRSFEVIETFA